MKLASKSLTIVLALAIVASGCSTSWIQVAISDLPIVLNIVTAILSIADVSAIPQAQSAGAEANRDLQSLQKFLTDFKAAQDAQSQKTALSNVQASITAVQTDLSNILAAVRVQNPAKQAAISAAVGVALSVVVSVQALLPSNAPKAARAVKLPSPKSLKSQYNSAIGSEYPSAVLH